MRTKEYLNPEIETASYKQVQRLQEAKLAKQLDYLLDRSVFYQEKFQRAGILRKHFRRLSDLQHFPFTTKDELRESQAACPPLGKHVATKIDDIIRVHTSTGTSGKPSFVGITRRDAAMWTRLTARSFYTQGLRKPGIVIHAAGLTLFVGGLAVKDAIESLGAMFVPIGTGASEKALMAIQLLKATAMHCTPSYASYFAEWTRREAKLEPRDLGLKKLFCGAEPGAGIPAVRAICKKIGEHASRRDWEMLTWRRLSSANARINPACTSTGRNTCWRKSSHRRVVKACPLKPALPANWFTPAWSGIAYRCCAFARVTG